MADRRKSRGVRTDAGVSILPTALMPDIPVRKVTITFEMVDGAIFTQPIDIYGITPDGMRYTQEINPLETPYQREHTEFYQHKHTLEWTEAV